jgi:hypothetical protein
LNLVLRVWEQWTLIWRMWSFEKFKNVCGCNFGLVRNIAMSVCIKVPFTNVNKNIIPWNHIS